MTAPIPAFNGGGGVLPPITTTAKPNFSSLARVGVVLAETVGGEASSKPRPDTSMASLYDDDLGGDDGDLPFAESATDAGAEEVISHRTPAPTPLAPVARRQERPAVVETTLGALMEQMGIPAPSAAPIEETAAPRPVARSVTLTESADRGNGGTSHMANLARLVVGNMNRRA